jgi:predicted lysophospholipase L1 biosynthesis ABC-type transport system permease subunit
VAGIQPTLQPLPAIVSEQVGMAPRTLRVAGVELPIRPVATSTAFPGVGVSAPFIIVSQPALADVLRSTPDPPPTSLEAWSMGADPTSALAAAGRSVEELQSAAVVQSTLDQQPPALAMGMDAAASIAALVLVVAGVAATLYVAQRRRAYEFAALLAMGAPPRSLKGAILREQLWLVGAASVAGLVLGRACVLLASPQLRASVGVRFPTPLIVVDAPALLAAFAALAVATYLATRAAGRALTRLNVTTVLRGEVE